MYCQFVFGNEDLTLAGIVEGVNDEIDRILVEGIGVPGASGTGISEQQRAALDDLASTIFSTDFASVPTIISDWITGLPDRITTYLAEGDGQDAQGNISRSFNGLSQLHLTLPQKKFYLISLAHYDNFQAQSLTSLRPQICLE